MRYGARCRTAHTRSLTSTTVTTYTSPSTALRAGDTANRLDYFYEDGAQTDLTWDDNGNLLTQGTSVYTWDAASMCAFCKLDDFKTTEARMTPSFFGFSRRPVWLRGSNRLPDQRQM